MIEWCPLCFDEQYGEFTTQVVPGEPGYPYCQLHGTIWGKIVDWMPEPLFKAAYFLYETRFWPGRFKCFVRRGHVRSGNDCLRCGAGLRGTDPVEREAAEGDYR